MRTSPSQIIDKQIASTARLARRDAGQASQDHPRCRPGHRRGVEMEGHPRVFPRRRGRVVQTFQGQGKADLRRRCAPSGPQETIQLDARRKQMARDRLPRRGQDQRACPEEPHTGCGCSQRFQEEKVTRCPGGQADSGPFRHCQRTFWVDEGRVYLRRARLSCLSFPHSRLSRGFLLKNLPSAYTVNLIAQRPIGNW